MRRLPHLCITHTHMHTQINILSIAVPTRIQLVLSSREIHCRTGRPQTRTILESQIDSQVYALLVVSFFYDNNSTKLFVLKRKFRFKSIYVEYKGSVSLSLSQTRFREREKEFVAMFCLAGPSATTAGRNKRVNLSPAGNPKRSDLQRGKAFSALLLLLTQTL